MSNDVFPTLAGLTWDSTKAPEFSTGVQRSVSLKELRASYADAPVWHFKLTYDVLREGTVHGTLYSELSTLEGFFLAHYGRWDSWLYAADDSTVSNQGFGTGTGNATTFQLSRTVGSAFTENVANANVTSITVNNTPTSNYTQNTTTGAITFNAAPAANAALRWSGTAYYRCRFTEDSTEFAQFMRNLWEAQTVEFVGSLGTAI